MTGDASEERPRWIDKGWFIQELCLMVAKEGPTAKEFAAKKGISAAYLSDVIRGKRDPGPAILKIMQYKRVTFYEHVPTIRVRSEADG